MTAFEYLSVALSFVVGLGVAHLLVAASRVFKRREQVTIDWITLTWSVTVFVHQIHFWWVAFGLSNRPEWPLSAFTMLLSFGLLLFVAGTLVLPDVDPGEPVDLRAHFDRTGRWAVLAVFGYDLVGVPFDYLLFETPVLSQTNLIRLPYLVVLLVVVTTTSRALRGALTIAYLVGLIVWITALASPSY